MLTKLILRNYSEVQFCMINFSLSHWHSHHPSQSPITTLKLWQMCLVCKLFSSYLFKRLNMLFELTNVTIDENYCTSFATFSSFNFSLSLGRCWRYHCSARAVILFKQKKLILTLFLKVSLNAVEKDKYLKFEVNLRSIVLLTAKYT